MRTIDQLEKSVDQQFNDIINVLESSKMTSNFAANINGKTVMNKSKGILKTIGSFRLAFIKNKNIVTIFPAAGGVLLVMFFPILTLVAMLALLYRNFTIVIDKK